MYKKAIVVMLATAAVLWFSLYLYIPYLTPALMALGLSASITGVIVALHSIGQMALRLPLGLRSGRSGRHKQMIVAGMLLSAAAAFIMYFWPTPWMFAVGNLVSGFSGATYVGITVLYATYYKGSQTNKAMGLISTFSDIGILAAFILGGFLWENGGIHEIVLFAGIAALIGVVLSLFIEDVKTPPTKSAATDLKVVLSNKQLVASSLLCLLTKMIVFGTAFAFTPKLAQDIGAKGPDLSVINGLFIGASVLGSYFITTKAGHKVGDYAVTLAGFTVLALYSITLPFVKSIPLFMVVSFIGGLGYSSLTTIFMANAVRNLPLEHKSTAMGVYQAAYSVGSALGPIVVGCLSEYIDKAAGFVGVGLVAVLGFIVTLATHRQKLIQ